MGPVDARLGDVLAMIKWVFEGLYNDVIMSPSLGTDSIIFF